MEWYVKSQIRSNVTLRAVKINETIEGYVLLNIDQTGRAVPIMVRSLLVPFRMRDNVSSFMTNDCFFYGRIEELDKNFLRKFNPKPCPQIELKAYRERFREEAILLYKQNKGGPRPELESELLALADEFARKSIIYLPLDKCPKLRGVQRDMILETVSVIKKQIKEEDLDLFQIPLELVANYPAFNPDGSEVFYDLIDFPRDLAFNAFIKGHYYKDKIRSLKGKKAVMDIPDPKFISIPMGGKRR